MPKQTRSPDRVSKRGKRQVEAAFTAEETRRTRVYDPRHIGYTQSGVDLTHLLPWARTAILGHPGYVSMDGRIFS